MTKGSPPCEEPHWPIWCYMVAILAISFLAWVLSP